MEGALRQLLCGGEPISVEVVKGNLRSCNHKDLVEQVRIDDVALAAYDDLLDWDTQEVANE